MGNAEDGEWVSGVSGRAFSRTNPEISCEIETKVTAKADIETDDGNKREHDGEDSPTSEASGARLLGLRQVLSGGPPGLRKRHGADTASSRIVRRGLAGVGGAA